MSRRARERRDKRAPIPKFSGAESVRCNARLGGTGEQPPQP